MRTTRIAGVVVITLATVLSAGCAGSGGGGDTETACNRLPKKTRVLLVDFGDPNRPDDGSVTLESDGTPAADLHACRMDKLRWKARLPFEVRFDKDGQAVAPTSPKDDLGLVAAKHKDGTWLAKGRKDKGRVRPDAELGPYRYRLCTPDCTAPKDLIDPTIIVDN